jgi:hypothetical protein
VPPRHLRGFFRARRQLAVFPARCDSPAARPAAGRLPQVHEQDPQVHKMAEAGLFDPRKPLPQVNALDFFAYRDFLDLEYGVSQQREGGVTLSIASNGGEVDWISGLLKVSTNDALKFRYDEDREIQHRFPGEFDYGAVPYGIKEHVQIVEDVLPDQADRDLVFWKTSNRIFRLGLTDNDPATSALVTV